MSVAANERNEPSEAYTSRRDFDPPAPATEPNSGQPSRFDESPEGSGGAGVSLALLGKNACPWNLTSGEHYIFS